MVKKHVLMFFLLSLSTIGALAQQPVTGQSQYVSCIACHGDQGQGNPALKAPALAMQSPAYLATQLKNFKSGLRGAKAEDKLGAQMKIMAGNLQDEQAIEAVANYIASLAGGQVQKPYQGDLKNGNNLFQGNCGSCHGGKAQGNPALKAPALAGLEGDYIIRQYKNYQQDLKVQ